MTTNEQPFWGKDFILLWVTNFLMGLGFYFLLPTLPKFAVEVLGAGKSQVGYIVGIYTLAALIIRPVAGYALDSVGRRSIYLWSLAAFALIMAPYSITKSLLVFFLLRILHGFSWGVTTTGGSTIVADILPPSRRGEGVGYFGLSMTVAMALGPAIGLWIMGENRFTYLVYSALAIIIAAFVLALFIKYPSLPLNKRSLNWIAFFEKRVVPLSVVMFFTTVSYGGIVSFITLYSKDIGIKNSGLFFLVYAAALSLVRPFAGKFQDTNGPRLVTLGGFLALIIGFVTLALFKNYTGFTLAAILIGIGNGMVWPTLLAMVINVVEPTRRGVANSTVYSALDLGIGGGSMLLGMLADVTSYASMYLACSLILLIPMAYFYFFVYNDYNIKLKQVKAND